MGTNKTPILANIYLAKLEKLLLEVLCLAHFFFEKPLALINILMDLFIYNGDYFEESGKFDVSIYQKRENKYVYITAKSGHAKAPLKLQAEKKNMHLFFEQKIVDTS